MIQKFQEESRLLARQIKELEMKLRKAPDGELKCARNGTGVKWYYYKDTSRELKEAGSYDALFKTGFSFDTPNVIDLALMRKHLEGLKNGETVQSPRYDFVTCESHPDGDIKKPAKVILTEGLYVLNEEVRDIMDVKVYVFTPIDVIKERWYKRAVSRGKTGEAADLQFKDATAQQYIRPTYNIADCIINGMVDKEYIKVITDKIMARLSEVCC